MRAELDIRITLWLDTQSVIHGQNARVTGSKLPEVKAQASLRTPKEESGTCDGKMIGYGFHVGIRDSTIRIVHEIATLRPIGLRSQ